MRKLLSIVLVVMFISSVGLAVAGNTPVAPTETLAQDGPPVAPIGIDFGVVGGYRYLRVSDEDVPVYDKPYGKELYRFQGGYDFVTPRQEIGSWFEINPGEWARSRHMTEVYPSYFTGVSILGEPGVPFGFVLVTQYTSNTPGGAPVVEDAFHVRRYTTVNLYQTVDVGGWLWYDLGGGRWIRQTEIGKIQRIANPGIGGRWVAVDLYEQTLTAYDGNAMVFATLISSGLPGSDTNPGIFPIWSRAQNAPMSGREAGYGDYRLENVPYAMYFDGDISLHGTYWHNGFGFRQSRGCVNLTISDARWLYSWFGGGGTVYVYYSGSY